MTLGTFVGKFWHKKYEILKEENKQLKQKVEGYERIRDRLIEMGFPTFMSCKEYAEQINKMKCCGNCKYSNQESVYSIVCKVGGVDKSDYINIDDNQVCDKWEIKENDIRRKSKRVCK